MTTLNYLERKLKDAEIVQRGQLEDQTIEDVVRSLKRQYSNEELPPALEKILDDRHMRELMNLLMRQYKEKAKDMKDSLMGLLDQKLKALEDIKHEFKHSKLMLKEAYEKGSISEQQFNEEMRKLKERKEAREEQVQVEYNDKERKAEKDIQAKLLDKHVQEQIDLEERQLKERAKYFQNLLPESVLK